MYVWSLAKSAAGVYDNLLKKNWMDFRNMSMNKISKYKYIYMALLSCVNYLSVPMILTYTNIYTIELVKKQ